jgi:hypothetical protein
MGGERFGVLGEMRGRSDKTGAKGIKKTSRWKMLEMKRVC